MLRRSFLKALAPLTALIPTAATAPASRPTVGDGIRVCEVCGEPAIVTVRDLIEIEPDPGGWLRASCHHHSFCAAHARRAERRSLGGTVDYSNLVYLILPKP